MSVLLKVLSRMVSAILLAGSVFAADVTNSFGTVLARKVLIGTASNNFEVSSFTGALTRISNLESGTSLWNQASSDLSLIHI